MKFPRYFLSLCVLAFFVVVVSAEVEIEEPEVDEVEARNPLLAAAIIIIKKAVKWAAKRCVEEAANNCKQHWKNPKALVSCAKKFLKANKGRCVVG
ncbi:uncharacterized protein LOC131666440 [Phymastichus coffea]|uniref:uncharacterized protein LOC131666440 n=1 Tax=Phymastichus coffea TaxID=108790 RepID=UPI00273B7DCE|nr:uncharacterized protein LOC131666440 [Phymastichus coffea]